MSRCYGQGEVASDHLAFAVQAPVGEYRSSMELALLVEVSMSLGTLISLEKVVETVSIYLYHRPISLLVQ